MHTNGKILVVEDLPEKQLILSEMLSNANYSAHCVSNGNAALHTLENESIDVILLDINLPDMDGYSICRKLKSKNHLKDIPIIFLSAQHDTESKVKAFELGGNDYVTKPFKFDELKARVAVQIENYKRRIAELDNRSQNFNTTLKLLLECLKISYPRIYGRSLRLKIYMEDLAKHFAPDHQELFGLAGLLAYIGCLSSPRDLVEKTFNQLKPGKEEKIEFQKHAEKGAEMLSRFPQSNHLSAIISNQYRSKYLFDDSTITEIGSQCLRVARQVDDQVLTVKKY